MQPFETEYVAIATETQSLLSKQHGRIKTAGAIFLALSACVFVGLISDIQNSNLRHALFPKLTTQNTQPMNGFFTSEVNSELCIKLNTTGNKFEATGKYGMAPDFLRSMSGEMNSASTGQISLEYPSGATDDNCVLKADLNSFEYTCSGQTFLYKRATTCPGSGGGMMSFVDKRIHVDLDRVIRIPISKKMKKAIEGEWDLYTNGMVKVPLGSATVKQNKGKFKNSFRLAWSGYLSKMFEPCESKYTEEEEGILFARMYGNSVDFRWRLIEKNRMIVENPDLSSMSLIGMKKGDSGSEDD